MHTIGITSFEHLPIPIHLRTDFGSRAIGMKREAGAIPALSP
jgi:hypothetical protein